MFTIKVAIYTETVLIKFFIIKKTILVQNKLLIKSPNNFYFKIFCS